MASNYMRGAPGQGIAMPTWQQTGRAGAPGSTGSGSLKIRPDEVAMSFPGRSTGYTDDD